MNDRQVLGDLRDALDEIAADIPNRAVIEGRVASLSQQRRRLPIAIAAAAIVVIAGLVSLTLLNGSDPAGFDVATDSSSLSEGSQAVSPPSGRPFSSTISDTPVDLVLPEVTAGRWSIRTDTDTLVELELGLDNASGGDAPVLRLFTVPGLGSGEVAEQLVGSLFDTDVVSSQSAMLHSLAGVEVGLVTRDGTNRAAFRLGPATYVETSGVNRRYLVRIFDRPEGSVVVWLDSLDSDFRRARAEAERLETGLTIGG